MTMTCKRLLGMFGPAPTPPPVRRIRVRVFIKDGYYEYYVGGRVIKLRYGYADLMSPKGFYHTWRGYANLVGHLKIKSYGQ